MFHYKIIFLRNPWDYLISIRSNCLKLECCGRVAFLINVIFNIIFCNQGSLTDEVMINQQTYEFCGFVSAKSVQMF